MMHTAAPAADGDTSASEAALEQSGSLLSATFIGLLLTQFLGATNDNILRWLVIGIGKEYFRDRISLVLAIGSGCFVLPYILLTAPAGYLADRFSKRQVIVICKIAEIVIMVGAVGAILIGNAVLLFTVVALMGAQAALFGPAKLGSIPEMLRPKKISAANGLLGLTTVIAVVVGSTIGNWLASPNVTGAFGRERWWLSAAFLVGIAVAGWLTSLMIQRLHAANPLLEFPLPRQWVRQTWRDLQILAEDRAMLRVALGIMFFWSLGLLAQLNIDQFASEGGATKQTQVSALLGALIVGVGAGSVLAGVWSGGKVELGILPLGAGGLALFSFLLYSVEGELVNPSNQYTASYLLACAFLVLLGVSSGLFDVPLAAFMQDRSKPEHRGAILAASNFLTFSGMLAASFGYWLLRVPTAGQEPLFTSRQIFLLCGLATFPVFIYIVFLIPQATIKFLAWLITHSIYRIRLYQRHNLPEQGGALLVPNHISWLDGLLLFTTSARPIRMLIAGELLTNWWTRGLATIMGAIPIRSTPKATMRAIETARAALQAGELVCIFPEGGITRSGQLQAFKSGVLEIHRGSGVPLIPVYLDELWGSIFSFRGGRFFWKWPAAWPHRVSIWFGKPIYEPKDIFEVRQAVQDLGADAVSGRKQRTVAMPRAMIRNCRKSLFRWKVADTTGVELNGGQLLIRTFVLRRLLLRHVLQPYEKYVGILLPSSVYGVVANVALSMTGRVAANLNYTASSDVLNISLQHAGIRRVLTSRKFTDQLRARQMLDANKLNAELVYLEDVAEKRHRGDELAAALGAYAVPAMLLDRLLGLHRLRGDDELALIFTSGSTGIPKAVMLTHHNIATNVQAIDQVVHPRFNDVILGIVPFFHSLGYMVTLWGPMFLDVRAAYHTNPLEIQQIGKLARKYKSTMLLAPPTFLKNFVKRSEPDDLATLDAVVAGAEKLSSSLCDAFQKKFGVRPIEGYGATELSPLVSVNVPYSRSRSVEVDCKEGSVGRPVPGVSVKVVDPETFEQLPLDTPGMLVVKGPNVMKGYLGQPEETARVIRDGWYTTGDIAQIDSDGFIFITGRLSRIAKIGGEMIPLLRIEDALQKIMAHTDNGEMHAAVTAIPDERRGERIIVLHTHMEMRPDEICRRLAATGMPNLWIPSPDSFVEVEAIPILGSGKTDLKAVDDLAKQHFNGH
ncbi:MAG TPA: acyl-[ACP]--phospholipid O-acyltransferase [Lacipirellulaceae bacterium]|jgi:acyl-[acyl-carrier-protein]-phospholipid O-acyltransferase/long-chain-fatty-acid--[acyl-carrier-protein] ligase